MEYIKLITANVTKSPPEPNSFFMVKLIRLTAFPNTINWAWGVGDEKGYVRNGRDLSFTITRWARIKKQNSFRKDYLMFYVSAVMEQRWLNIFFNVWIIWCVKEHFYSYSLRGKRTCGGDKQIYLITIRGQIILCPRNQKKTISALSAPWIWTILLFFYGSLITLFTFISKFQSFLESLIYEVSQVVWKTY